MTHVEHTLPLAEWVAEIRRRACRRAARAQLARSIKMGAIKCADFKRDVDCGAPNALAITVAKAVTR